MSEVWKDIPGYEGLYQVSNLGGIVSMNYRRTKGMRKAMTPSHDEKGYRIVILFKDGKRRTVKVHRIVAKVFIPNPSNLPEVNHIDGDKTNNCVDNLEWADRKANMAHANRSGALNNAKAKLHKWNQENWKITVIATNIETGEEKVYNSLTEAANGCGVDLSHVSNCINGVRKTTGGFKFRKVGEQ